MVEFAAIPRKQDHSHDYGGFSAPVASPSCAASLTPAVGDAVAEAWERILGAPASRSDHLLDVLVNNDGVVRSGNSVSCCRNRAATGVHLPLTVVFGSPTAAALVEMVQNRDWPQYERPVRMRSGVGQPLFVLPGVGGMGLDVLTLVRFLNFPGRSISTRLRELTEPSRIARSTPLSPTTSRSSEPLNRTALTGSSATPGAGGCAGGRPLSARFGRTIAFLGMIEPVVSERSWTYGVWLEYMGKRLRHHLMELGQIRSPRAAIRYGIKRLTPLVGRIGACLGSTSGLLWRM